MMSNLRCSVCGASQDRHNVEYMKHSFVPPRWHVPGEALEPGGAQKQAKRKAYLSQWAVKSGVKNEKWPHLEGVVFGHPSFADGVKITTSPITLLDLAAGRAVTIHTEYILSSKEDDDAKN